MVVVLAINGFRGPVASDGLAPGVSKHVRENVRHSLSPRGIA
jgi:hypothetical protein